MTYYIASTTTRPFDETVQRAKDELAQEGFGILTEIDVTATLRAKTGADFRPYRILGACNPAFALEALRQEDKVGTMLPCNVVVQQLDDRTVEIAAVDPVASMQAIGHPGLLAIAKEVRDKLRAVIARLRQA